MNIDNPVVDVSAFGQRMRLERKRLGLSQESLGKRIGMTHQQF